MPHIKMKIIFLGLILIICRSCAVQTPAVYKTLEGCTYQADERYVNLALDKEGQLFLEEERLAFSELYPALIELKRSKYQKLRKKEQQEQRYFVINFCTHPEADYAEVVKVREILKQWDSILVY